MTTTEFFVEDGKLYTKNENGLTEFKTIVTQYSSFGTVMDFQPITPLDLSVAKVVIVNMPSLSTLAYELNTCEIIKKYTSYKTELEEIALRLGSVYTFEGIPKLTKQYFFNHPEESIPNLKYDINRFIDLLSKELLNYIRSLEDTTYVVFKSLKSSGILIFQKKYKKMC